MKYTINATPPRNISCFHRYEPTDAARPWLTTSDSERDAERTRKGALERGSAKPDTRVDQRGGQPREKTKPATMRYGSVWKGSADETCIFERG